MIEKTNVVSLIFVLQTDQGVKNFSGDEATEMSGKNPDYATQDLYDAIADGNPAKWSMFLQVMTLEQAEKHPDNPFDVTKVCLTYYSLPLHYI